MAVVESLLAKAITVPDPKVGILDAATIRQIIANPSNIAVSNDISATLTRTTLVQNGIPFDVTVNANIVPPSVLVTDLAAYRRVNNPLLVQSLTPLGEILPQSPQLSITKIDLDATTPLVVVVEDVVDPQTRRGYLGVIRVYHLTDSPASGENVKVSK